MHYFQCVVCWRMQGKLIEIHFSSTGKISGAKIQTCEKLILILFEHFNICYVSIPLTDFDLHFSSVSANSIFRKNSST